MSDTEQKVPNKTGASGAAWSDAEKIAYLIILCEAGGKIDSKIAAAPIPAGRSVVSCQKLLVRLKEKHKEDIEKIKAGQPVASSGDGEAATPGQRQKTPRKRKPKSDTVGEAEGEGSPKKKPTGRRKKTGGVAASQPETKEDVKDEGLDDLEE